MIDDFDNYFYREEKYHEDMLMAEAEAFYNDFYGEEDNDHHIPSEDDGDYDDLLDELDFIF